jgi:hypothetical protein
VREKPPPSDSLFSLPEINMKIRQVLAVATLVIGTAAVAKADTCVAQIVTVGVTCSLGDLTFTFDEVSGLPVENLAVLALETPPKGSTGI